MRSHHIPLNSITDPSKPQYTTVKSSLPLIKSQSNPLKSHEITMKSSSNHIKPHETPRNHHEITMKSYKTILNHINLTIFPLPKQCHHSITPRARVARGQAPLRRPGRSPPPPRPPRRPKKSSPGAGYDGEKSMGFNGFNDG